MSILSGIGDFAKGLIFDDAGNIDPKKVAGWLGAGAGLAAINNSDKVKDFLGIGGNQQPIGYTGGIPEYNVSRGLAPNAFSTTTPTGEPRRPGSMGRRYFTDTTFTPTGQTMSDKIGPVTIPTTTASTTAGAGTPTTGTTTTGAPPAGTTTGTGGVFDGLTQSELLRLLQSFFNSGGVSGSGDVPASIEETNLEEFAAGGLASLPKSRGYYLGGATDGMADDIPATINNTEPAALSDGEFVIPADVVSHLGNGNSDAGAKQLYAMMDRVRRARTGREEQGRKINPTRYTPV